MAGRSRTRKPAAVQHAEETHVAEPTLAAVVRAQTGYAWSKARDLCTSGRVTMDGMRCIDPAARVLPDVTVVVDDQARRIRPSPLPEDAIVFADGDVVVVDKPPGMLSVPDERDAKATLAQFTRSQLRTLGRGPDTALGVVHRLDRDTSGLMVFARSADAQRKLAAQFRLHDVERTYVAIAHGRVGALRIESWLLPDRGDGLRGSFGRFRRAQGDPPPEARRAITHVTPIAALDRATLIECRLETGRQHQIRIHLAEHGHPLVGESVYIRDHKGTRLKSARVMLHAKLLGFVHPRSGERMTFEREPPEDFRALVEALRKG